MYKTYIEIDLEEEDLWFYFIRELSSQPMRSWDVLTTARWHHLLKSRGTYVVISKKPPKTQHIINVLYRDEYRSPTDYLPKKERLRKEKEEPRFPIYDRPSPKAKSRTFCAPR